MIPVIAVPYGSRMFTMPPAWLDTNGFVEVVSESQPSRLPTKLWSYPDFVDMTEASTGLQLTGWALAGSRVALAELQGDRIAADTLFVSRSYFQTVGASMAQGAGFVDGTDPTVIISHQFWQRRMNGAADVVGQTLDIDRERYTIVGITPEGFSGHMGFHEAELFLPLERHPGVRADTAIRFDRNREWVQIHGRMEAGVSIEQTRASLGSLTREIARTHEASNQAKVGTVEPYHPIGALDGRDLPVMLAVLQTLTFLPLLVVCLNIAGMVQVRNAMREKDLSIRQAIGASRGRLVRHLLSEAVVLAAAGAVIASVVLFNLPALISWAVGAPVPARMVQALTVDVQMIGICLGLCLLTSLLFGLLPAARFSRPVIITALKDDAGGGGVRVGRLQRFAAALQIAIATPLLIIAVMTLDRMRATAVDDIGFDAETLIAVPLNVDAAPDRNGWTLMQGARDTMSRVAGVEAVALTDGLPLDFRYRITRLATQPSDESAPRVAAVHVTRVGEGYFDTTGIEVIRGRGFTQEDSAGAEPVVLLSKPTAERLFPDAEPLGQRLTFRAGEEGAYTVTVVGVTSDFPTSQMSTNRAQILLPLAQHAGVAADSVRVNDDRGGGAHVLLVARSAPGVSAQVVSTALEQVARDIDPDFVSTAVVTGEGLRERSVDDFFTQSMVGGTVGGVLLLLAALGVHGVVGLMVATRVREIAVRVAMGASSARVLRMVLWDVGKLAAPGIVVGILLAVAFVKLNGEDFGIALSSLEPLGYVIGSATTLLMALAAGFAPARRAASVQPMVAMRSE
jgi:predicted permease